MMRHIHENEAISVLLLLNNLNYTTCIDMYMYMYTRTSVISTFPTADEQSTNTIRLANAAISRLDD